MKSVRKAETAEKVIKETSNNPTFQESAVTHAIKREHGMRKLPLFLSQL